MHRGDDRDVVVFSQFLHQVENLLLVTDVEGAGGFVQEQYLRLLSQCPSQDHALQFAAGKFGGSSICELGEVEPLDHRRDHRTVSSGFGSEAS